MPSAQLKSENVQSALIANSTKQTSSVEAPRTPQEQPEYIKQALTIIEKKVRNLDKRRIKLEEYRDLQAKGQTLNADQLSALSKYDEVKGTLEVARDLDKQLIGLANDALKAQKKQQKREQKEREEQLRDRLREIQRVQILLSSFVNETVRQDFLAGANGSSQITQEELSQIDEFSRLVSGELKLGRVGETELNDRIEHFYSLVDARPKVVAGSATYADLRKLFERVLASSYWDAEPRQQDVESEQQVQSNTSTDDYVIVSQSDAEGHQAAEQQQHVETPVEQEQPIEAAVQSHENVEQTQDRTFFTTLNPSNLAQEYTESSEGINFLQESEVQQVQQQYQEQPVHQQPTEAMTSSSHAHHENNRPQVDADGFQSYKGRNNRDNDNRNGGFRRSYDGERRGGQRGGFSSRGGPRGGGRGGSQGGQRPSGPRPEGGQRGGFRGKPRGAGQHYGGRPQHETEAH